MAQFSFQQEFQILKDVSLGAISIFTSLLAIVAPARLLPQDMEDRTVYTILAKPVPRFEYLVGKIAVVLLLLGISTLVMAAAFLLVLYMREQAVLHAILRQMPGAPPDQIADALRVVRSSAFKIDMVPGISIIYLKACLLAALTLFVSTFATTNIFTIVVMAFIYFIGHLQATAREYWLQAHASGLITKIFLAVVALLFPDLQAFNLVDDLVCRLLLEKKKTHYADTLSKIDDPYLRERALDIQDVTRRIVRNLQGNAPKPYLSVSAPHVLVAHNLTP